VAQVAFSVVLLSAASLFVHHLSNLRNQDVGFRRTSLLLVTLDPSKSMYPREQLFSPYQDLLGRLGEIPSVRSVTLSAMMPPVRARLVSSGWRASKRPPRRAAPRDRNPDRARRDASRYLADGAPVCPRLG
jgi:hypothetical protein